MPLDVTDRDDAEIIRDLVTRLSRSHPSGGHVIERASILAEGANFAAVVRWITEHSGEPEAPGVKAAGGGMYGSRLGGGVESTPRVPLRYVLPPGALSAPPEHDAEDPGADGGQPERRDRASVQPGATTRR